MATRGVDQGRHHRESAASIRLKAQKLRRALDDDRLEDAVRVAADVAAELRAPGTAALTPKAYYDVYLSVCAELRVLEMYMMESARRGAAVLHLYERVQETPLVLPRLYLLVTTGSVYVRSAQAPAKDVLRDLVEMCAAVQHPQRGLFLRAYLSQMMKDKLPDSGPPHPIDAAGGGVLNAPAWSSNELDEPDTLAAATAAAVAGTLVDSVEFVLRNFTEMNRLWVRMKNNVPAQEEETVRKERLELRLLVGSNLSTLGRLLSNDMPMYTSRVLPALVEQIIDCRDAIAQEYLADCVAQAFPDDFQLATLDAYLRMCAALVRGVNLKTVLTSIIDRLTKYVLSAPAAKDQVRAADVFSVFHRHFPAVLARQSTAMSLPDRLTVYLSLMRLVLTLEPEKTESVDAVLALVLESAYLFVGPGLNAVEEVNGNFYSSAPVGVGQNAAAPKPTAQPLRAGLTDEEENLATRILAMPLDEYQDVAVALRLGNFAELQHLLCFEKQYILAARVLRSVREYTLCIESVPDLEKLFVYVRPLVVGEKPVTDRAISEDINSPAAIFNPATLSSHHAYLAAEVSLGTWNAATATTIGTGNTNANTNSNHNAGNGDNSMSAEPRAHPHDADPNSEPASVQNYGDEPNDILSHAEQLKQFQEAQELVARIVFLCHSDSVTGTLALYNLIRRELLQADAKRRAITLPPLALSALQLAMRVSQTSGFGPVTSSPSYGAGAGAGAESGLASLLGTPVDILMFAVECIDALASTHPMLALRLHLQAAVAAGTLTAGGVGVGSGSVVYDALARAFQLFEDAVTAAGEQFTALELLVAVLASAHVREALAADAYTALARRAEKHAANLLSRSDQCLALLACTALYDNQVIATGVGGDGHATGADRAVACIDRAVAAARAVAATAERFFLWVSVANRIVAIVEAGIPAVAGKDRLKNVMINIRDIVANRSTKNVPLGRAALRRRALLLAHIRARPNIFSFLSLADL